MSPQGFFHAHIVQEGVRVGVGWAKLGWGLVGYNEAIRTFTLGHELLSVLEGLVGVFDATHETDGEVRC